MLHVLYFAKKSSCQCPWMLTHWHTHNVCGWCEVWDSGVDKQTQTIRAFSHTYQQHLGWGSNERDKSTEKHCKFDPIALFFFSFLALVIIYQLTADKPVREAEENEALEEIQHSSLVMLACLAAFNSWSRGIIFKCCSFVLVMECPVIFGALSDADPAHTECVQVILTVENSGGTLL